MMRHTQSGGNGCLIAPEVFEPVRRQLGVPDRVLDVLVAEPCLQRPRIVPGIGQGVAAGVPQHVREDGEGHTGAPAEALEQRAEALGGHWAAALTGEHVWRCLLLTLQARFRYLASSLVPCRPGPLIEGAKGVLRCNEFVHQPVICRPAHPRRLVGVLVIGRVAAKPQAQLASAPEGSVILSLSLGGVGKLISAPRPKVTAAERQVQLAHSPIRARAYEPPPQPTERWS